MRPGLLLFDEPTANLDPAGVLEVRDAVGRCLDKTAPPWWSWSTGWRSKDLVTGSWCCRPAARWTPRY